MWGLTRLTTSTPSASAAVRSWNTGKPVEVVPTRITSMLERMGAPRLSSLMPAAASTPT